MSMMPVAVSGIFNHQQEIMVEQTRRSEKGLVIVTPFYTHLNNSGKPCAILVNRGWVPIDLRNTHQHQNTTTGTIYGTLIKGGDAQNKWSISNSPTIETFTNVKATDFALID